MPTFTVDLPTESEADALDLDTLNAVLQAASDHRDRVREHLLALRALRDRKAAEAAAEAELATMSDERKAALARKLGLPIGGDGG